MNTELSMYSTEINLNTIFLKRTNVFNLLVKSNNYLLFFFYNNIWFFMSPLNTFNHFFNNIFSDFFSKKTKNIFFSKQFKNNKLHSKNSKYRPLMYKHLLQIPTFLKTNTAKKTYTQSKYIYHDLFITFYSKLFRSNNLRIVTPLLKANPYQFLPQSKTSFTKFFKSKNFCNVVNQHKRLKFLELLTDMTKKIKITSLKEKQLTDFKNFSKLDSTNKQKNFNFLLPRQNVFLNTRKQLDFNACKPVSTMLLAQVLSMYKRGVKKNWTTLTSSTNKQLTLQNFLKKVQSSRSINLNIIPLFSRKNNKRGKLKWRPRTSLLIAIDSFTDERNLSNYQKSFTTYIGTRLHVNKKQILKHLKKIKNIKNIKLIKLIKKLKKYGINKKVKKLYKLYKLQKSRKLQKNQRRGKFLKRNKWKKYSKSKNSRYTLSLRKNKKSFIKFNRTTLRRIGLRTSKSLQALSFQKLTLNFRHSLALIGSITNKWFYLCCRLHIGNRQKTKFKRLNFLKKKNNKKRVKRRRYKKIKPIESTEHRKEKFLVHINKNDFNIGKKYKTGFNDRKSKMTKKVGKSGGEKLNQRNLRPSIKLVSSKKNKSIFFNFKNSQLNWIRRRVFYTNKRQGGTRLLISKKSLIQRKLLLKNSNQVSFFKTKGAKMNPLRQKSLYFWVVNNILYRDYSIIKTVKPTKQVFSDDTNYCLLVEAKAQESTEASVEVDAKLLADFDYSDNGILYEPAKHPHYIYNCWESRFFNVLKTFERHLKRYYSRKHKTEFDIDKIKHFKKEVKEFISERQWLNDEYNDVYSKVIKILTESDHYLTAVTNFKNNRDLVEMFRKFNPELRKNEVPFLGRQSNDPLPIYRGWLKIKQYIIKADKTLSKKKINNIKTCKVNVVSNLYNVILQEIMSIVVRKDMYFKLHEPRSCLSLHNSLIKYINVFKLNPFYRNILISRKPFITGYKFITFDLNLLFKHVLKEYLLISPQLKPTVKCLRAPRVPKDYHLFSKYNRSFISLSTGFLFTNCNFLYHKRFRLDALKVSHMNRQRYSFFYKNDIKRFYLHRSSNLTFLQNLDQSNFLRNNLIYDRLYLRKNHHSYNSFNSVFTNSIVNTSIDAFFLKYRSSKKPLGLWGHEQFFYTHQAVTSQLWEPRIKRIRFKPGYQRIWRKAREGINFSLKFNLRYQHRLTHKLAKLRFIKHKCTSRIYDLTLLKIILNTRFVYDLNVSKSLINNSLVYVNGVIVSNPQLLLYVGDFIQLVISIKYYIIYRWLVSWNATQRARLVKLSFYKSKAKHDLAKQKSRILPDWIFNIGSRQLDIPKYTEVDYFTLSIFIIYEPLSVNEFNPLLFLDDRSHILNMYNWKFIN